MINDQKKTVKPKNEEKKLDKETQELELKLEVETLKKEIEDCKTKYLRALADYQNLEKRVIQEKDEVRKFANSMLILQLLPFLDHLEKAEIFIKDPGLKMIRDNFWNFLKNQGLQEIDVLNKEFDPNLAEAIDIVQGDKDNQVMEIVRKGYIYNGKIFRVAQVKVSKKLIK